MNPAVRADLLLAAPELWLLGSACLILLVDLFLTDRTRQVGYLLALVALAVTAWTVAGQPDGRAYAFAGMYVADGVSRILKLVACGTVACVFLYSRDYLINRGIFKGEYFVLGRLAL